MSDTGGTSGTAEQDVPAASATDAGAVPGGQGEDEDGGQLSAAELARQRAGQPWLLGAGKLVRLVLLAGAGAWLRVLAVPGAGTAIAAWLVLTAAGAAWWYLRWSRAGEPQMPPGAWRPGQPLPDGLPPATAEVAGRMLAQIPSRRWRGAWLEIRRCTDPVRHGECRGGAAIPAGNMIKVVLGEHLAENPRVAAFTVAHEIRHPAGWTCHLSVFATWAQMAGWLIAGWAVPWPWLLATLAGIHAAHEAACWVTEIGCDLGGARAEGSGAALEAFAWFLAVICEPAPGPAWRKHVKRGIVVVSGVSPHPPVRLRRAIIRAWVPDRRQA